MSSKLDNNYIDTQITELPESDTVTFILREGQDGDKLLLNLEGFTYSWQPSLKSLIINTNESANINHIINSVSLEGKGNADRFIEAQYTSKNGEIFSLEEYSVQPVVSANNNLSHKVVTQINNENSENIDIGNLLGIVYEENLGADFINAQDENIPYKVKAVDDGRIYEILQDSFEKTDSIEIFNYDLKQDKVDINNFIKDFQGAFNYDVLSHDNDVQLSVHHAGTDYSIVFKDIAKDLDDDMNNLLNTIIFKL